MKKILRLIPIIIALVSFQTKAQEVSQMKLVMDIHDEVMAKMSTTVKLVHRLSGKTDSSEYETAINDLKASNKSMVVWMEGFGKRFDADEMMKGKQLTDQKKVWLNEEEVKVKALRDQINSSIERAETLLAKE
ncbi:MAG: hypothetical protein ABJN84_02790 [Flavobacteriaceae bacterium]